MSVFSAADILLPREAPFETWSVIACDQFTSQPEYWKRVREYAGVNPTTVNLILPEAELGSPDEEEKIARIRETMRQYEKTGILETYRDSMIYVERTLQNGSIRRGLIGKIDLEAFDYHKGSDSLIRSTEETVLERIPPRMRIRREASMEFPHILLLCDDSEQILIEPVAEMKDTLTKLYDFDLMEGGGHITGWLLDAEAVAAFDVRLTGYAASIGEKYQDLQGVPMLFAMGDGNHSLATAKACYEELKAAHPDEDLSGHPARYALVELENIHDDSLVFEPIHRIVTGTDAGALLAQLKSDSCADGGYPVRWYIGNESGMITLDRAKSELAVGVLQGFLDEYLKDHPGKIDYIHGDDTLRKLAKAENSIGVLLPAMEKSQLFRGVIADGALPRKTFSMGHAQEKRYYLEGRSIG